MQLQWVNWSRWLHLIQPSKERISGELKFIRWRRKGELFVTVNNLLLKGWPDASGSAYRLWTERSQVRAVAFTHCTVCGKDLPLITFPRPRTVREPTALGWIFQSIRWLCLIPGGDMSKWMMHSNHKIRCFTNDEKDHVLFLLINQSGQGVHTSNPPTCYCSIFALFFLWNANMKHVWWSVKRIVAPCCVTGDWWKEKLWFMSIMDYATATNHYSPSAHFFSQNKH